MFDADGKLLATFNEPSTLITLTDVDTLAGTPLALEALLSTQGQTRVQGATTLRLIQHRPGDNAQEVERKRKDNLRHELEKRKDDVLAVQKQTADKIDEMARRLVMEKQLHGEGEVEVEVEVMDILKDEEFLGLVGVQLRHKSAIIEIEETEEFEICYHSWRGEVVELAAGVLCEVEGLVQAVMVTLLIDHVV